MDKYNNGHAMDVSEIPVSEYEIAAKEWAEGSESLEKLLIYCLKNNIVTQACCSGNQAGNMSYVQFELSEKNINALVAVINKCYNLNDVSISFTNQPGVTSNLYIGVHKDSREYFFKDVLSQISDGSNLGIDSLSADMRSTVNAMLHHKVPNEYLEVQYLMNNNQRKMFVATSNPNYSALYWDSPESEPWVESSIGIQGTPEKIIPIIDDIYKKADFEYGNYIDSKIRLENQSPTIHSVQQLATADNIKKEPEIAIIIANPQATRESDYARQNQMTIVDALPGASINQVAKAICGKRYICQFNNFEIEGTKYINEEQIIEAYAKNWEEGKKRFVEAKKLQEQIDGSVREQQIAATISTSLNQESQDEGIKR